MPEHRLPGEPCDREEGERGVAAIDVTPRVITGEARRRERSWVRHTARRSAEGALPGALSGEVERRGNVSGGDVRRAGTSVGRGRGPPPGRWEERGRLPAASFEAVNRAGNVAGDSSGEVDGGRSVSLGFIRGGGWRKERCSGRWRKTQRPRAGRRAERPLAGNRVRCAPASVLAMLSRRKIFMPENTHAIRPIRRCGT